jgi:hypothetical protein
MVIFVRAYHPSNLSAFAIPRDHDHLPRLLWEVMRGGSIGLIAARSAATLG